MIFDLHAAYECRKKTPVLHVMHVNQHVSIAVKGIVLEFQITLNALTDDHTPAIQAKVLKLRGLLNETAKTTP